MKVVVFGLGYVGATTATCLASAGHDVVGIDVNESKVDAINAGRTPIVEPGLAALLAEAHAHGRIKASSVVDGHLTDADVALVCVGTPSATDGSHDMSHVAEVSRQIATAVGRDRGDKPLTVAFRSTFRPGTLEEMIEPIFRAVLGTRAEAMVELVYNPEFLRSRRLLPISSTRPRSSLGRGMASLPKTWSGCMRAFRRQCSMCLP